MEGGVTERWGPRKEKKRNKKTQQALRLYQALGVGYTYAAVE